jgi:hypothetical protein
VLFFGLLSLNCKPTEYDLPLSADLPDLLADPIQKEKLDCVTDRLAAKRLTLSVPIGQRRTHRLRTDLLAIEILNDPFELPGTHSIEKESPNGTIHIATTTLVAIKHAEFHTPGISCEGPRCPQSDQTASEDSACNGVPVSWTPPGPLVPMGSGLIDKLLFQEIFDECLDEALT